MTGLSLKINLLISVTAADRNLFTVKQLTSKLFPIYMYKIKKGSSVPDLCRLRSSRLGEGFWLIPLVSVLD